MSHFFFTLVEQVIRNISGSFGRKVRYIYYKRKLGRCGTSVFIDEGVFITNPKFIFLGSNIWIDKSVILIAGFGGNPENTKFIPNSSFTKKPGEIHIGSNSHLGIGTIIQGHGGVEIEDYFTTSAGCKIYSLSDDPSKCKKGTFNKTDSFYIATPVKICDNVWLGLNVNVIGNTIGSNSFITTNSVVYKNIPQNSFAEGTPAISKKPRFIDLKK
jgi:acetyltransferase-like isoleucine patch superfamily enzyme